MSASDIFVLVFYFVIIFFPVDEWLVEVIHPPKEPECPCYWCMKRRGDRE